MPKVNRIAAEWQSFVEAVGLQKAPEIQRSEMRRAFYAGAQALLSIQLKQMEPGLEPTDNDLAMMDAIAAELQAFSEAVRTGRA